MTENNTGFSIELPKFKEFEVKSIYDYEAEIVDYESLEELDKATTHTRLALFKVTNSINKYERHGKTAKMKYERQYRRKYLESTEKTDSLRRAWAALACEDLENNYLAYEQLKGELERVSYTLRLELQALQSMGNNLRQQLRVV